MSGSLEVEGWGSSSVEGLGFTTADALLRIIARGSCLFLLYVSSNKSCSGCRYAVIPWVTQRLQSKKGLYLWITSFNTCTYWKVNAIFSSVQIDGSASSKFSASSQICRRLQQIFEFLVAKDSFIFFYTFFDIILDHVRGGTPPPIFPSTFEIFRYLRYLMISTSIVGELLRPSTTSFHNGFKHALIVSGFRVPTDSAINTVQTATVELFRKSMMLQSRLAPRTAWISPKVRWM